MGANITRGVTGAVYSTLADLLAAVNTVKDGDIIKVFEAANRGDWYISTTNEGGGQLITGSSPALYANPGNGGGGMFVPTQYNEVVSIQITQAQGVDQEVLNISGSGLLRYLSAQLASTIDADVYMDGVKVVDDLNLGIETVTGGSFAIGNDRSAADPMAFTESLRIVARNSTSNQRNIEYAYDLGTLS